MNESLLWRAYTAVTADPVNVFFLVVTAIVLFAALAAAPRDHDRHQAFARAAPGLLTSLGVLGTFVGIFIGLVDFDVSKIDDSVPKLLAGMKIAFATSILGMGSGILVKLVHQRFAPMPKEEANDVTGKDLVRGLAEIRESVDKVRTCIAGDADGSMVTQVQKLRTAVMDGNRDTLEELRTFGRQLAENNAKMFIDALRETIRDFNEKLSEQFGENFKELNVAVGRLLEWQERYKAHVDIVEDRFKAALAGIEANRAAVAEIADKAASIPATMQGLERLLSALDETNGEIQQRLEAFAAMRQQALEAFPVIEQRVLQLTDGFSGVVMRSVEATERSVVAQQERLGQATSALAGAVEKNIADITASVEAQEKALMGVAQGYEKLREDTQTVVITVGTEVGAALGGINASLVGFVEAQEANLQEITAATTQHIGSVVEQQRLWSQDIQAGFDKLKDETAEIIDRLEGEMERAFKRLALEMKNATDAQAVQIRDLAQRQSEANAMLVDDMRKQFSSSLKETEKHLIDSVATFDRAMQEEITRVMETMGSHLASLSGKFVDDYTPLTDRLREVVRIAQKVDA